MREALESFFGYGNAVWYCRQGCRLLPVERRANRMGTIGRVGIFTSTVKATKFTLALLCYTALSCRGGSIQTR